MSAAEKLKALDAAMRPTPHGEPTYENWNSVRNALPQILAVVEAAELEAALAIINDDRETSLGHALAALEEALP